MCSNCEKYEVAKTHLCGFNDWCEECDTSLWSTANDVTVNGVTVNGVTVNGVTVNEYEEDAEDEDYIEKMLRCVFLVNIKPTVS
jgi:hypothetical protein